jgi:hypothetical protein
MTWRNSAGTRCCARAISSRVRLVARGVPSSCEALAAKWRCPSKEASSRSELRRMCRRVPSAHPGDGFASAIDRSGASRPLGADEEGSIPGFATGGPGGGFSDACQTTSWVQAHFKSETVGGTTVYDLSPTNLGRFRRP